MHNYILLIGLVATIFFFLVDKNLLPATLLARRHMLSKLENNKSKDLQLQSELEQLIDENNAWSYVAFPDSEVTYKEYLELLREKFSIEYSDSEFQSLRTNRMSRGQMADYIQKIKNQEEAALALQMDVNYQKRNLQSLRVYQAS
jgi:predicted O-linked N-acetylglucosamine transferase (SPINDLY family)